MQLPTYPKVDPFHTDPGGVVRVGRSRVTLDSVVHSFNQGATAEDIAQQYPALTLADVYSAIAYYLHFRAEVDAYLAQRQEETASIQQQNEARFDPTGVRQRLLARKPKSG